MPNAPVLLRPEPGPGTLKEVRWGGARLAGLRGGPQHAGRPIGESWELSTLPGHESRARGEPLSRWLPGPLPFVVKLIDTAKPLSIQLHPDDEFHPDRPGKEEAWVILDAADDASLLAGLRPGVTRDDLGAALRRAHADAADDAALLESLRRIEVRRGMCILIPAGTVHAIGPGILLMEIQQPVDCTFRLYDYGSGRPLHPQDAMAALHVEAQPRIWSPEDPPEPLGGRHVQLHPHRGSGSVAGGPTVVVVVQGDATVSARGESEHLGRGDLVLALGAATVQASATTLWVEAGLGPKAGSAVERGP